jgi:hypothetical protein
LLPIGAVLAVSVLAGALGEASMHQAVATAPVEMKATMMAASVSTILYTHLLLGLLVPIPAFLLLALCAIAGAMRGPRGLATPAIVGVLGLAIAGVGLGAGLMLQAPLEGVLRLVLYGLAALLAAVACLGRGPETSAPLAGAAAAAVLPMLVISVEVGLHSYGHANAFQAVAAAPPAMKGAMLQGALTFMSGARMLAWVAVGLASMAAVVGASRAGGTPYQAASSWAGLAPALVLPAAVFVTDASGTLSYFTSGMV